MKKTVISVSLLSLFMALTSSVPKPLSEGINGPSEIQCGQTVTYTSTWSGPWQVNVNETGAPVQIISQSSSSITIRANCNYVPNPSCPCCPAQPQLYNIDIEKGNGGADLVIFVKP